MHTAIRFWLPLQIAVFLWGCAAGPAAPARVANAAGTGAASSPSAPLGADGAAVDPSLVQRGYHPRMVNGELKYCRSETVTGSLFSSMVCLTKTDIKAREDNAQNSIGMAHRGDGGCAKTPCN